MAEIDWAAQCSSALGEFTLDLLPPTLKLPALPHAVTLFLQKSNDPKTALKDLAQIVETDTGLTVELLRHVNSTYVGLRTKAKSALQALTLLGQRQSKLFIISTGMQAAVQARQSRLINQACFWNASLQKALFAREVALLLKADPEVAFAGALLQDFLLPVLTNDLLDNYVEFVTHRERQPVGICAWEHDRFGWDHALAAACLSLRWQLPEDLVCCVLHHHAGLRILLDPVLGRTAVAAVALSGMLPDQLRQTYDGLEQLLLLQSKWPAFDLQQLVETVDRKHAETGLGIRNDFPLARRCQPVLNAAAATPHAVAACVGA